MDSVRFPSDMPKVAGDVAIIRFDFNCGLNGGDYLLSVGVAAAIEGGAEPLDRRYDSIHIHVVNPRKVFGLVDLDILPTLTQEALD